MSNSSVQICNRALQILGESAIISLSDNSKAARECNLAYDSIRESELRAHSWNFSIARASLAASTSIPIGDEFAAQFPLPTDCLRVLPPNHNFLDWQIEGRMILTNYGAPLNIRYISSITDVNTMDAEFRECLSAKIGEQICEALTQSNTKQAACRQNYRDAIARAKKNNAYEQISATPPLDTWVTARNDQ